MKNFMIVVIFIFSLSGCISHNVSLDEMLMEMHTIQTKDEKAYINILWYKGSDSEFYYFAYVYAMTGTNHYKVKKQEVAMDNDFLLTSDSTKWIRIREIDDVWHASRKYNGTWKKDSKGVSLTSQ